MKCSEVRELLVATASQAETARLRDHLSKCPACADLAGSALALRDDLTQLQQDDLDDGFAPGALRARVEGRVDAMSRWERIMSHTKFAVQQRPALFAGLGFTLMIVAFASLVPLPHQSLIGYRIALPGWNANEGTLMAAAVSALSPEGVYMSTERESDETRVVIDVPKTSARIESEDVRVVVLPRNKIVNIEPYYVIESRPLLAQLLDESDKMRADQEQNANTGRRVAVRVESLREMLQSAKVSDEKVAQTVKDLLNHLGVKDSVSVTISTDEESRQRLISLIAAIERDDLEESVQLEIMIDDGNVIATRASTSQRQAAIGDTVGATTMLREYPIIIKVKLKDQE